jgi:hypothetical protein
LGGGNSTQGIDEKCMRVDVDRSRSRQKSNNKINLNKQMQENVFIWSNETNTFRTAAADLSTVVH